jgi:hypothetical protein
VKYLDAAGTMLGHLDPEKIQQLGEMVGSARTPFAVLDGFKSLREPDGRVWN